MHLTILASLVSLDVVRSLTLSMALRYRARKLLLGGNDNILAVAFYTCVQRSHGTGHIRVNV